MKKLKLIVFMLVGAALVALSWFTSTKTSSSPFWQDVLTNIGLVLVAVVVVEAVWSVLGGEPMETAISDLNAVSSAIASSSAQHREELGQMRTSVRLLDASAETGLRWTTANSGDWGSWEDWMKFLRAGVDHIDLMGHTLQSWRAGARFKETLVELASNGCRIRVLTMDPENPHLGGFAEEGLLDAVTTNEISSGVEATMKVLDLAIADLKDVQESLTPENAGEVGSIERRSLLAGSITMHLARVDDRALVLPYLTSSSASASPLLEIHGRDSSLFRAYMAEFDSLWLLSEEDR